MMRSSTIFLLLVAFVGFSSASRKEWIEKAQLQVNLILHAHNNQETSLLYKLIPFGYDIDSYLKSHRNAIKDVRIVTASPEFEGEIKALALIHEASETYSRNYHARLTLIKNRSSPTGYIMARGYICEHPYCRPENKPLGFY